MAISFHRGDLPADLSFGPSVAIDTETMGLNPHRDRLCLVQLSAGDGNAHLVQIPRGQMPRGPHKAPRLAALLADPKVLKLFHFGRFDIAMLEHALGVRCEPVYCTKIAAKLTRTFTDRFGLKDLCKELLGVDLSKQQQTSPPPLQPTPFAYRSGTPCHSTGSLMHTTASTRAATSVS